MQSTTAKSIAKITALNLFSVRSCAGQDLQQAEVTPHGLKFDRQWRLITPAGDFLTQNQCPKMALIYPTVEASQLRLSFGKKEQKEQEEEGTELSHFQGELVDRSDAEAVPINDKCAGVDQGEAVADWLTAHLDMPVRLLRVVNAAANADTATATDFARPDMSPVLVISEESLADLNARLPEPVLMNRFRPNIVVSGLAPYEEETWTSVYIGDVLFVASTEPCGRCPMINIDQEKGAKAGKDPLKTLAGYRRQKNPNGGADAVIFGKYMVPASVGRINVGDAIKAA